MTRPTRLSGVGLHEGKLMTLPTLYLLLASAGPTGATTDLGFRFWPAEQRAAAARFEQRLNDVPKADSLRAHHDRYGEFPHVAGTPADLRTADNLAEYFTSLGLEVERHEIWAYLCSPVDARLELVTPEARVLPLKEDAIASDPFSAHPDLSIGWNAYSGNGDVTAPVVYANYGTKEDFGQLKELHIDPADKIVVVRYGHNFRGYKAKFAEEAGAAGLIIYTDPTDAGYVLGLPYPEGGYHNGASIQRGSILTLDYSGDPLTPGTPATKDAVRLDPRNVALPKIPVQPVGWSAASEILSRMHGPPVPKGWQGGLPFTYRLSGGPELTVRLRVEQRRELLKTYNIVGTLRGGRFPDQKVIAGCHHDAWGFGASDPLAGLIVLLESAKSFAALASEGQRPARSVLFGAWAAEEFGIIGSTEWVEAHREDLHRHAVAYINLDMAAMGPRFGAAVAAVLRPVVMDVARSVPGVAPPSPPADAETGKSVFDRWLTQDADEQLPGHPRFGHLGGGSDHVGFYCHLGIPSAGLGAGGSEGSAYHTAYDDLVWYRQVVGSDYEPARMMTRVANGVLFRLADAPLLPLDPAPYGPDVRAHLRDLHALAARKRLDFEPDAFVERVRGFEQRAAGLMHSLLERQAAANLSEQHLNCVNDILLRLERAWLVESGIPGRPWFRSLYAAPDEDSGYAAWMLPALRSAVERRDSSAVRDALRAYRAVFHRLDHLLDALESCTK